MKANNNTLEITNGVEYRVILSIEGKKNQTTAFTTRKSAKAAIREMERDLMATNTGYVIRLICNVYEDGELVTNSELGRCQFDPSKVITVKAEPSTDTPANEGEAIKNELGHNKATRAAMIEAARAFLMLADELNEKVSAYIDGSNSKEAESAYYAVKEAEANFLKYNNAYWGENRRPCLGYELAESALPEDDEYFRV